ncbi:zinc finger BED domain-containing protein RICESLEEPER 3-like [Nicotiana tomentosiformis]|uniref:zinc finger BED domain-containing protein RICESLEEPER 3-like n=1 Tax=Nicotiana tomentosiformis TaxID=4098 RepID=UPI00388CC2F2
MDIGPTETPDTYCCMNKLNDYLQQLYNYYANIIDDDASNVGNINLTMHCTTSTASATMDEDEGIDGYNIWSTFPSTQTSSRNIDELQFYLQKQTEPRTKEFSPLGWWHENEKQFPALSAIARDVLNVLISTVASDERKNQGREAVDKPEDEKLGDILTHGNPSEFNTPKDGQEVHIDDEELNL